MIKHVVFFKLKAGYKTEVDTVIKQLQSMKGKVKPLEYIEVGKGFGDSSNAYDICLQTHFLNRDDLFQYQSEPTHVKIKEYLKDVCGSIASVDYEV